MAYTVIDQTELRQHEHKTRSKRKVLKECIVFTTPERQEIKYWTVGIGLYSSSRGYDPLPRATHECCHWDRHPFSNHPVGCPITYHNVQSGIEADRVLEKLKEKNVDSTTRDFFETEGIFCSFSCAKAYALDELQRTKNNKYKDALGLLTLLYEKVVGKVVEIKAAPGWRLLDSYGGHLSIEEFRNISDNIVYEETVNIKRPYMFSSFSYIKEKQANTNDKWV